VSQRRSSPCGLFSRAEDKLKLSDDEIEEAFTRSATVVERYFTDSAVLWAFCRTNHRFKLHKRGQQFLRVHNETLFRYRDVRLQSRSFARWNPEVNRNRAGSRLLFLAEFLETRIIPKRIKHGIEPEKRRSERNAKRD